MCSYVDQQKSEKNLLIMREGLISIDQAII